MHEWREFGDDVLYIDRPFFSKVCDRCRHYRGWMESLNGLTYCDAYPKGIPDPIWNGQNDHTQPCPGDHGIQFEALDDGQGDEVKRQ